ncbi:hypothetical protein B0T20DRAFT_417676 [Sordaria brevicollis]|uniref:Uncharacterized protein n=1 Tax=Sordaria brevicollis TaxID=83679 RepID=A0AAE0UAH6_SORBR|nr:hypothetical protein B0T20DRAFT_417676 [Sordaria brevicollis]
MTGEYLRIDDGNTVKRYGPFWVRNSGGRAATRIPLRVEEDVPKPPKPSGLWRAGNACSPLRGTSRERFVRRWMNMRTCGFKTDTKGNGQRRDIRHEQRSSALRKVHDGLQSALTRRLSSDGECQHLAAVRQFLQLPFDMQGLAAGMKACVCSGSSPLPSGCRWCPACPLSHRCSRPPSAVPYPPGNVSGFFIPIFHRAAFIRSSGFFDTRSRSVFPLHHRSATFRCAAHF